MNNQNHIISAIQDHETRLSRDEAKVKEMATHLKKLSNELEGILEQNSILAELNVAAKFASSFNTYITSIQRGLYGLMRNQLDPSLVSITSMKRALNGARYLASRRGLTIALVSSSDLFQIETNFVAKDESIFILVHVSLLKTEGLVDI